MVIMVIRSTEKSTCGPKLHSAVHGMPSCSKDTTTSLQVSLKICDQKNKPNCLKTDKSDWAKTFFHFNLTVVLSGHMTILLKFYLRHQKWPKLAPNSPTMAENGLKLPEHLEYPSPLEFCPSSKNLEN